MIDPVEQIVGRLKRQGLVEVQGDLVVPTRDGERLAEDITVQGFYRNMAIDNMDPARVSDVYMDRYAYDVAGLGAVSLLLTHELIGISLTHRRLTLNH